MENRREFIEIVKKIKKQKVTTENKRREEMKRGIKQQTFQSMEDFEGRLKSMKLKKEGNSESRDSFAMASIDSAEENNRQPRRRA